MSGKSVLKKPQRDWQILSEFPNENAESEYFLFLDSSMCVCV